jgi:putative heme transporter
VEDEARASIGGPAEGPREGADPAGIVPGRTPQTGAAGDRGGEQTGPLTAQDASALETKPVAQRERAAPPPSGAGSASAEEEMPRVLVTRRRALGVGVFVLASVGFLYFVLPKLAGLGTTVHRIESGDTWWVAVGVALELLSFAGYMVLFHSVFVRGPTPIGWRECYQITMAGLAATRLFAAGGAGGVALTAWALRRSGMEPRAVACRLIAFLALLYSIFMGSLLIDGVGLATGLFPGGGSFAITIVPAIVATAALALAGAVAMLPQDVERRLGRLAARSGRLAPWVRSAATVPALAASGVRTAIALIRSGDPGLLGAVAWWGFDISVLWAMFHAFGTPPPFTVIWMAYFVGMLGNLLPLPGGLGGVEGAMIGAFVAFGVNLDLAVLAVLSYRAIAFWLPTPLGAVAYLQLRHTVARWRDAERPGDAEGHGRRTAPEGPRRDVDAAEPLYFTK